MDDKYRNFAAQLPYPEIKITYQNPEYARILLEDYCGLDISELSAVTGYIYGHFVIPAEHEEIAESLRCISIIEMRHLELLADAICQLGLDPRFRTIKHNGGDQYWTAEGLDYAKSVNNILLNSIEGEKRAIEQYRAHCELIDDSQIEALLKRIILDEELHLEILNKLFVNHNTPK